MPRISRWGCEQPILTCGPARGVVPTTLPDAAGGRAVENPATCELPAKADSQHVVSHCKSVWASTGSDASGFVASQGGWGPAHGWLRLRAPRERPISDEASVLGPGTHLALSRRVVD